MSLLGGITGIFAGIGLGSVAGFLGYAFSYSAGIVFISFGFAVIVVLVFGIFPAYHASF